MRSQLLIVCIVNNCQWRWICSSSVAWVRDLVDERIPHCRIVNVVGRRLEKLAVTQIGRVENEELHRRLNKKWVLSYIRESCDGLHMMEPIWLWIATSVAVFQYLFRRVCYFIISFLFLGSDLNLLMFIGQRREAAGGKCVVSGGEVDNAGEWQQPITGNSCPRQPIRCCHCTHHSAGQSTGHYHSDPSLWIIMKFLPNLISVFCTWFPPREQGVNYSRRIGLVKYFILVLWSSDLGW